MKTNYTLWTLPLVGVAVVTLGLIGHALAQSPQASTPASVMNEELMARIIKYTRSAPEVGAVTYKLCKVLDLCDGTKDMPLRLSESSSTDGNHYFGIPPEADSKDILIVVKHGTTLEAYLTDKACTLRAAAVLEDGIAHLITNEKATAKFKSELSLFAHDASFLPPTGSAP